MSPQGFFNFIIFNSLLLFVPLCALLLWRKPSWWMPLCAAFLGFMIGWFDLKATEVSPIALMLLTFGFFTGFARPRRAWLWGLLLGMWIPVFAYAGAAAHVTNPTPTELVTSFLALVFPLAGAYAGVVVRRLAPSESILELNR